MRSIALLFASALLLAALPTEAALSPQYQRAAELRAILDDSEVVDRFGPSRLIERIEFVEDDLYRVFSGPCHLDVRIVDKPATSGIVGPRQFEVVPGELVCE